MYNGLAHFCHQWYLQSSWTIEQSYINTQVSLPLLKYCDVCLLQSPQQSSPNTAETVQSRTTQLLNMDKMIDSQSFFVAALTPSANFVVLCSSNVLPAEDQRPSRGLIFRWKILGKTSRLYLLKYQWSVLETSSKNKVNQMHLVLVLMCFAANGTGPLWPWRKWGWNSSQLSMISSILKPLLDSTWGIPTSFRCLV